MSNYTPSPELVEAVRAAGVRDPEGEPMHPDCVRDTLTAAVAYRTPDNTPELVPWVEVQALIEAARRIDEAATRLFFTPDPILAGEEPDEHDLAWSGLRAALAPFHGEPRCLITPTSRCKLSSKRHG